MMKKIIIYSILFSFVFANLFSCNFICGKLNVNEQKMIDSVNSYYVNKFRIENIPCEYIYINLKLYSNKIDTISINQAHKILYDEKKKLGWQTIIIYDKNGKYVISHSNNGVFYYQTGD